PPSLGVGVLLPSACVSGMLEPVNIELSTESVMVAPDASPVIVTVTVSSLSNPVAVIVGNVVVLCSATLAVVPPKLSVGVSADGFTVTAMFCDVDDACSPVVVLFAVTVSVKPFSLPPSLSVSVLLASACVSV